MKRVGQVVIVLAAVLATTYFLLVDVMLKGAIEREGSKALRAELNIASVNFRLFPLGITLQGLQATNPHEPLRNLVTVQQVTTNFTLSQILDHQIVADNVSLQGLRFNQPRLHSGAIAGLTPSPVPPLPSGLPGLSLPTPQALLASEKTIVQATLRQLRDDLTQTRDRWQQRMQALPDQTRIDGYHQREQSLRQANPVQRLAGADTLRRDVKADLDNLNALREQARTDWQLAQTQLAEARTLPQRELDRLLTSAGLNVEGGELKQLTQALLGAELAPLVAQLQGLAGLPQSDQSALHIGSNTNTEAQAAPGWRVLARAIHVDGQFDVGSSALRFVGVIHNVTPQPAFFNVTTDFDVQAAPEQIGKLAITGTLDQRKTTSANVRLAMSGLPLEQLVLGSNDALGITLQKTLLDVDGLLRMENHEIDFNLLSLFKQAELTLTVGAGSQINPQANPLAKALASALRTVNQFDLNLAMTGSVQAPNVQLRSSLDQLLAAAVGDQIRAQTALLAATLQSQLQQQVQPDLDAINQLGNDFQVMQQTLLERQDALQSLLDLRSAL